jgi:hypothetical protein
MAGATSRISRVLVTGPLAPFAEDYRRELRERGYTERSAVNQLRQVTRFSRWLQAGQLSVPELTADRVEEFLGWQRAVGRHRSQWSRPGARDLRSAAASARARPGQQVQLRDKSQASSRADGPPGQPSKAPAPLRQSTHRRSLRLHCGSSPGNCFWHSDSPQRRLFRC